MLTGARPACLWCTREPQTVRVAGGRPMPFITEADIEAALMQQLSVLSYAY